MATKKSLLEKLRPGSKPSEAARLFARHNGATMAEAPEKTGGGTC
jgi:hypothetical protein